MFLNSLYFALLLFRRPAVQIDQAVNRDENVTSKTLGGRKLGFLILKPTNLNSRFTLI
jgi:hypothetical protein